MKLQFALCLLLLSIPLSATPAPNAPPLTRTTTVSPDKYYRTELYFGRLRPDGSIISDEEWNKFVNEVVTPRFPSGFTVLDGLGQYKDRAGKVIKEPSKVLIFLYLKRSAVPVRRAIEEIRENYKTAFRQESVLRVDVTGKIAVSF